MNKKILIIEDDLDLIKMLKLFLEQNNLEVEFLSDPNQNMVVEQIKDINPDMILMDMDLPHTNGIAITEKIGDDSKLKNTPIFFVSGRSELELKLKSFDLGAYDYITKPFQKEELLARIHRFFSFEEKTSNNVEFGKLQLDLESRSVTNLDDQQPIFLSQVEFNLLYFFIKNESQIVTRDELIENIWKGTPHLSSRVVDVHISSLRKKIKPSHTQINSVYGKGYQIRLMT